MDNDISMAPIWCHNGVVNITLKSVPKKLHSSLKQAARRNGRSINTEAIATLEREYLPVRLDPLDHLQRVHETRARQPLRRPLSIAALKRAIAEGRE